ncbi:MAG: hypothetical protein PHF74_07865 [Dehalococcoidales bacterium]|nr:hypothetical protein [Dehalococcoidales bacterium]
MIKKLCIKCKVRYLPADFPGNICPACAPERIDKTGEGPHYDVADMMNLLGLESGEQVRRLARQGKLPERIPLIRKCLWDKAAVDEMLRSGRLIHQLPQGPRYSKALAMCKKADHSWMEDEEYAGFYESEPRVDKGTNTLTVGYKYVCRFCGYEKNIYI